MFSFHTTYKGVTAIGIEDLSTGQHLEITTVLQGVVALVSYLLSDFLSDILGVVQKSLLALKAPRN